MSDAPGWYDPTSPEPARSDVTAQEQNQFLWAQNVDFPFLFALRAELEQRAGGNVSSNVGVIYLLQLLRSSDFAEVRALYAQAGLNRFHHLSAKPPGHPYPYPDFVQVIYMAEADDYIPTAKLPDDYEIDAAFRSLAAVQALALPPSERLHVSAALAQKEIVH